MLNYSNKVDKYSLLSLLIVGWYLDVWVSYGRVAECLMADTVKIVLYKSDKVIKGLHLVTGDTVIPVRPIMYRYLDLWVYSGRVARCCCDYSVQRW